jgi:uncharacterized protein
VTEHWPAWLGGLALASVGLGHWLILKRELAVSGRFTAIVNAWRLRRTHEPDARDASEVAAEDMIAALRAMTAAEFGSESIVAAEPATPSDESKRPARASALPPMLLNVLFLGGLALGGALSVASSHAGFSNSPVAGHELDAVVGHTRWLSHGLLLAGGVLVGFGTRMAGGCTSGHGLCGVSRLQKGSLLSTATFFSAGVLTSFFLELWT